MTRVSRLHFITNSAELAEKACAGGIDWIQLRLKNTDADHYLAIAREVRTMCTQYGATLIINDNVAVAAAADADGVHLGKTDMDPNKARKILGPGKIIGGTANTRKDIMRLAGLPVDYVGLGPFRFTATKQKLSPIVGLKGYERIMQSLRELSVRDIPVLAIGGIRIDDVEDIMSRGVHGVAVSGAISSAVDVRATAAAFIKTIHEQTRDHHE